MVDRCELCQGMPGRWITIEKASGGTFRLFLCGWCAILLCRKETTVGN